ncbi:UDP-glucose dehydrogenase family [Boletus reticuloceps]|uniref:UDP-glucose 6-dehydrogenase n=1 Tax=Boletus reticuloceps TaxID=495285 RepID=A0A8I2YWS7_9AGAM|nr:UDP-glucose dehydrogenase family [Boletus reticuloceps]
MPAVNKICCIGAGYVGGPTCAVIALKCPHIQVTIVDINQARIDAWNSKDYKLPIYEPGLEDVVREARGRNLFFSTDVDKGIQEADLIFVSVNTPTKKSGIGAGFAADLNYVELATRRIAAVSNSSKIVVEKSTVPCRTAESMRTILEANSPANCRFDILSNPEFLAEGTAVNDLFAPDRVLVGSLETPEGKVACDALTEIYANWVPRERILTPSVFLPVNALSAICEATGANIDEVAYAVGKDSRVGPSFLRASVGFGGSCFQKDILNLVYLSDSLHLPEVANYWRQNIAVLGFAFKADTGDTRESAAISLVRDFQAENANVNIYDPQVVHEQIWSDLSEACPTIPLTTLQKRVKIFSSALEACKNAEAVVIATEWKEFRDIDWNVVYLNMRKPAFVFDGRILLDADKLRNIGFKVTVIGRGEKL